jgi:hypothetical protein
MPLSAAMIVEVEEPGLDTSSICLALALTLLQRFINPFPPSRIL